VADVDSILPYIHPGWKGVEIGVSYGQSSLALFLHGVRFLWLVDPWAPYEGDLRTPEHHQTVYREAMERLSPYAGRHSHLRMRSADAAKYIPPPVDFVFIDGDHRYEAVKDDCERYWPLILPGGILCGHDYTDNADTCQVKRAVGEFANAIFHQRGRVEVVTFPDISSCWLIHK
jgi:predicted O-methyltransferase YrrM